MRIANLFQCVDGTDSNGEFVVSALAQLFDGPP